MSSKNTRSGRSVKPPKRMIAEDSPQDESSKDISVVNIKAKSSTQRQKQGQSQGNKALVKSEQLTKVEEKSEKISSVEPTQIHRSKRAAAQAAKSSLKEKPINTKLRRGDPISKSDVPVAAVKPQSPMKHQRPKRQDSSNKTDVVSVDSKSDAAPTKRAAKRVPSKNNLAKAKDLVSVTESPHKKARLKSKISKEEISKMLLENDDTSNDELDCNPNNAPEDVDSDREVTFNMSRTRSSIAKKVKDLEAEADKKKPIYMRSNSNVLTKKVEIFNDDPFEIDVSDDDDDSKKKKKKKRKRKPTQKKKADMLLVFGSNSTLYKEALKAKNNLTIREKKVIKPKQMKKPTQNLLNANAVLEEKEKLIRNKQNAAAEKSLGKNSDNNEFNDFPVQTELHAPSVIVSSPQNDYTNQNIPSIPNVEDEPPVFDDYNDIDIDNNDKESTANLNNLPPQNPIKDPKRYMTPVIPKHTKKMIQERKASTPRVNEEPIKPPTKEEQIKKCFGFDDSIPTGSDDSKTDNESLVGFSPVRGFQASNQIMISPTNSISSVNSFTRIRDSTNFVSVRSVPEASEGKTSKSGPSKVIGGRFEFIRPKGSSKFGTSANSFKSSQIGHKEKGKSCSKSATKSSATITLSESVKDERSNNVTLYQDPETDVVPLESENGTMMPTDTANTDQQAIPNKGETNDKKLPTYKNSKKKNQKPLNTVTNTLLKTSTAKATKQPLIYETDGGSKRLRANKAREKQPSRYYVAKL